MANEKIQLQLVSPSGMIFDEPVDGVIIMTEMGQITVLPWHSPLVSILEPGEMIVQNDGTERAFAIAGGVLEISENVLRILADSAEMPNDIDIEKSEQRAKELAKELQEKEKMDITSYNMLLRSLQQEQARLQVGKKWKKIP